MAEEIDRRLAEGPAYDEDAVDDRRTWREGLALVDELARRRNGVAFLAATPAQRLAILTAMAANERQPGETGGELLPSSSRARWPAPTTPPRSA